MWHNIMHNIVLLGGRGEDDYLFLRVIALTAFSVHIQISKLAPVVSPYNHRTQVYRHHV